MEKGTRVRPAYLKHRCNSQREIDAALEAGFDGVEVDLVWRDGAVVLCHEHGGVGPDLEYIDFRDCVVAVNIKEYGFADYFGEDSRLNNAKDHFFFDVPGPELDLYCMHDLRVFGRFSQWEDQTIMRSAVAGALLDDFTGTQGGQVKLVLGCSQPIALISNQLRSGEPDSPWVLGQVDYVICKEKL